MSKKLIITIACAFAAQAQGDDDIYSQIRQSNQTHQITQAIEDQGKAIIRTIEAQSAQPRPTVSITTEDMLASEAKAREQAAKDAVRATKPSRPFFLPTTGLESKEEIEKLKADVKAQREEYKKAMAEWLQSERTQVLSDVELRSYADQ